MHSPMQSLGESNTHPSTPCSASGEWGGKRSTPDPLASARFRRGDRFKSGGAPAPSVTVSIMRSADRNISAGATGSYSNLITGSSQPPNLGDEALLQERAAALITAS